MPIFLLVFLLLYGGLHAYFFFKAQAALALGAASALALAFFLLLMVLAPILVHLLERQNWEAAARPVAYVGYVWISVVFLFFTSSVLIDLYRLVLFLARPLFQHDFSAALPSSGLRFFAPAIFALAATAYGYFEAQNVHLERLVIRSPKIPAQVGRLKIAQISDVHLGIIVNESRLKGILDLVQAKKPDLLISTGDLVDGEICHNEAVVQLLRAVNPRYGKYAITGNHEFYAGLQRALECTQDAGFRMLRGEKVEIAGGITLAGVDDPEARAFGNNPGVSEKQLLSADAAPSSDSINSENGNFTILLKHRPTLDPGASGLFDLQLSGHTHKGQIFPFTLLSRLFYPHNSGTFPLTGGSLLYVSRGSGTWGPPIRFVAPPEVTIIELIHAEL